MIQPPVVLNTVAPQGPWQPCAARDEIKPRFRVDRRVHHGGDSSLAITCDTPIAHGWWQCSVPVQPKQWYRFEAWYRQRNVPYERQRILARLDWQTKGGQRSAKPDYVFDTDYSGDWRRVQMIVAAPDDAASMNVELHLGWSPGGTVWWGDISLTAAQPPKPRIVRLATINHRPQGNKTGAENVREFCALIDEAAKQKPDIICLPEAMTVCGTGLSYVEGAEPIPGPTSETLGRKAQEHHCYLVACYDERDGHAVYNTAILIDREGKLVGKYHKVYVPREEIEAGITPGDAYPVFGTDFGKVGLMICWDVQWVDPAQALAAQGAEVLLLPIWGGSETLMKARALENAVWLVTSGYDAKTWIINPKGEVIAEGTSETPIAVAEVNLDYDRRASEEWLGNMRARFLKERRTDVERK